MPYTDINNLELKSNDWLATVGFYREDLEILEERLAEVAAKNTHKEVLKEVEHFQNQFDIQKANMADYTSRIKHYVHLCAEDVKAHAGKVNLSLKKEQELLGQELVSFEKIVKSLRADFNRFLAKWM